VDRPRGWRPRRSWADGKGSIGRCPDEAIMRVRPRRLLARSQMTLWRVKHLPQRLAFCKGAMPHQRLRIEDWSFPVRQEPTIPIHAGCSGFRLRGNEDRTSHHNGSGNFGRQRAQRPRGQAVDLLAASRAKLPARFPALASRYTSAESVRPGQTGQAGVGIEPAAVT
jgi:hypothetical protein